MDFEYFMMNKKCTQHVCETPVIHTMCFGEMVNVNNFCLFTRKHHRAQLISVSLIKITQTAACFVVQHSGFRAYITSHF